VSRRAIASFLTLALLAGAGAAWAQSPAVPFGQYFRAQWEVAAGRDGRPVLSGYVYSAYGLPALDMRLLVETLDASGRTTTTTVGYVDSLVPPFGRTYFEVPLRAAGASYRVSVTSFFLHNGIGL